MKDRAAGRIDDPAALWVRLSISVFILAMNNISDLFVSVTGNVPVTTSVLVIVCVNVGDRQSIAI